jgi:hypothetical protein
VRRNQEALLAAQATTTGSVARMRNAVGRHGRYACGLSEVQVEPKAGFHDGGEGPH